MREPRIRPDVDTALEIVRSFALTLPVESVLLADAFGRIIAEAPRARLAVPRFRMSAMDGFALNSADTRYATSTSPSTLRIVPGFGAAGTASLVLPGNATHRIATGSPMPEGADAVLPDEAAAQGVADGETLALDDPVAAGRNVRQPGEDILPGAAIATSGVTVSPAIIGLAAAAGLGELAVRRWPRVHLLSTGSELAPSGADPVGEAAIFDSNGPMLSASLRELGLPISYPQQVPDDRARLRDVIDDRDADLIISTGGVSVGDHDLLPDLLRELGATIHFNGVAMRPGKPILFAALDDGRPFFGLPGNPVAALVGFRFFVTALLRAMLGLPPERGVRLPDAVDRRSGTTLFLRGRKTCNEAGTIGVELATDQRSHILSTVAASNCWVRADGDIQRPAWLYPSRASLGD